MSVSQENGVTAGSDSFWEIGQYKRTVRRIDDGAKLCQDLVALARERGEIEAGYAKQLHAWGKKWNEQLEKGPEYGTLEAAWKGVLEEAGKRAELAMRTRDRLAEEVANTAKLWHKDHFHPKTLGGLKESKEMDDAYRKAQKPWAKLYGRLEKARREYHAACKTERTAIQADKNAAQDSAVSPDHAKKLQERVERCGEERERAREAYDVALRDLNASNAKYMEDMTMVFEKCQEMELKRLKFFKEMLFGIHKCLDLSKEPRLEKIYQEYWQTVDMADAQMDLKYWAHNHGTHMPMNWPTFQDYTEDLRQITNKGSSRATVAANTIQLKGLNVQRFQQEFPEYSPELRAIHKKEKRGGGVPETTSSGGGQVMLIGQKHTDPPAPRPPHNGHAPHPATLSNGPSCSSEQRSSEEPASPSPYEDDWDEPAPQPVTALYDYQAQEDDELSFKKGDTLEKLEDEDEQGWCKGRLNGVTGLYPANYAQKV